jgi:hypothetical protein
MEIDGSCHCGEIRYKAEVNPDNVIICHCTIARPCQEEPFARLCRL